MKGVLFISHQTETCSYIQSVQIALDGGIKQIQLRIKDAPEAAYPIACAAKKLCDSYSADLYIDDYVDICKNIGAKGVHLGKLDMLPLEAITILGKNFVIGGTANTFDDILHLTKSGVNYIGLGPFRFTHTKNNLSPILGLEGYTNIINNCRENNITLPILAIGGITVNDIPHIMETGVSGIAISSAILNAKNPIKEAEKIVETVSRFLLI